jgi:hypothetical protein
MLDLEWYRSKAQGVIIGRLKGFVEVKKIIYDLWL